MRQLRRVVLRLLLITTMLATGIAAVATGAAAAVPDRWGFALVDVTSGIPSPSHQAGSWPGGFNVTVSPGGTGEVFVKFPMIGAAGVDNSVVHVTAISELAQWCQAEKWWTAGTDEIVAVRCYLYGGTPQFSRFSIVIEDSSGGLPAPQALGYVYWNGGATAASFNSAGAPNTVVPTVTGVWTVTLNGVGSTVQEGGFQVTAVDSGVPARCKLSAWSWTASAQKVQVRCFDATNVPLNTGWTLTYQRQRAITGAAIPPKYFAYTYDNMPAALGPYTPVPAGVTFNSVGSFNEIQSAGPGLRLVTFHKVGVLPDHVQVTAFGPGPQFCNLLTTWATSGMEVLVRDVACYNATTRANNASMISYTSAL
ncbi:hypothetical protein [Sphaerisporangium fuscum]|uniref:hypothetical protein n=1 Tax=Sphaerisporangium fuscum TaxID=2835868 RepID=UPI001BDBB96E|nr:hypothetical protein [Sphaerisporangium fuscum]